MWPITPYFCSMTLKFFLSIILLISLQLFGQNNTTAQNSASNDWSDNDTWVNDDQPGCFDTIFINTGITVDLNINLNLTSCGPIVIVIDGQLNFSNGKKLTLASGSLVIVTENGGVSSSSSGGGNSNYIQIGSEIVWSAADPDITSPIVLGGNPLGVGLSFYEIRKSNKNDVLIEWETYFELNNSHFEIEKQVNNNEWNTIAHINAGTSSNNNVFYREIDPNLPEGQYYYRLVQYDLNGVKTSFTIKSIQVGNNESIIIARYDLMGRTVTDSYSGIVVVKYKNGNCEKIYQ